PILASFCLDSACIENLGGGGNIPLIESHDRLFGSVEENRTIGAEPLRLDQRFIKKILGFPNSAFEIEAIRQTLAVGDNDMLGTLICLAHALVPGLFSTIEIMPGCPVLCKGGVTTGKDIAR